LFVARDAANIRQPILGGLTAAAGPSGGVMLYFGTGSFSFTGDPTITNQQTIYGIFDNGTAISGRSALLRQTYGATANGFRTTSNNAYVSGGRGWYLDLPISERFIGNPRIESGIVFFPTYEPTTSSATDCSVGGINWLYGLKALNGGAAFNSVRMGSPTGTQAVSGTGAVALTTGSAAVKDVGVFASPRLAPLSAGATQAEIDAALAAQCSMVVRVAGADPLYLPRPCGRQSWRQVR
jgi:type IV pilus assembly protein PilY1